MLLLAQPILTPALSPEDQCSEPVASNNGRPRFRSGSLFCGSGPFPSRWPLLNFGVALEIDLIQVGAKVVDGISQQFRRQFHGRFVRGSLAAVTRGL